MLDRLRMFKALMVRRLRHSYRQAFVFAMVGALVGIFSRAAHWSGTIERSGMASFLEHFAMDSLSIALAALMITFGIRLSVEHPSDLIGRPWRFVLLLVVGTAAATLIAWTIHVQVNHGGLPALLQRTEKVVNFWMQAILFGGLIGWTYLLSLQRAQDQALLGSLLGKRMLLARQLARSRLGTARARIDPAMVARVLSEVHARYRTAPAEASVLLDHLISYLRLAMNRMRSDKPTVKGEITLIHALAAMREVQHGIVVQVKVTLSQDECQARSGPLFLVASALLDDAIDAGARAARLCVVKHGAHIGIELETAILAVDRDRADALASMIAKLLPVGWPALERIAEAGANKYVVKQV